MSREPRLVLLHVETWPFEGRSLDPRGTGVADDQGSVDLPTEE